MRTINLEEIKLQYVNGKYYLVTQGNGNGVYSKLLRDIDERENNEKISRRIEFKFYQNAPNPFNSFTDIQFGIPKSGFVRVSIFDLSGNEIEVVLNAFRQGGIHNLKYDGSKLLHGTYFCKIAYTTASEKLVDVKKISKQKVLLLRQ